MHAEIRAHDDGCRAKGECVNREGPNRSRRSLLGAALVTAVFGCGAAGVLLARHVLHPAAPVRAASGMGVAAAPPPAAMPAVGPRLGPAPTAPTPVPSPVTTTRGAAARPREETPGELTDEGEIRLALGRWQRALLSNDATQIAPSYAMEVDRYFLQTGVSRAWVLDYMERMEERGVRLTAYDLQNITIKHLAQGEAEVGFQAAFQFSTPSLDRKGNARTVLRLRREEGDWKIFYERDFRSMPASGAER